MNGAIGDVREVHVWTNRPFGFWPQGIPRPAPLKGDGTQLPWNNRGITQRLGAAMAGSNGSVKVPDRLSWDLFLGVAPQVEYHPALSPVQLARMGGLGPGRARRHGRAPDGLSRVGAQARPADRDRDREHAVQRRLLSERDDDPLRVPRAERHAAGDADVVRRRPHAAGSRRSSKASSSIPRAECSTSARRASSSLHVAGGRLLPNKKHNDYGPPKERLPRVPHGEHEMNWVNAICGRDQLSVPFDYAAHLTEIMLLGIVSLRAGFEAALRRCQHARHEQSRGERFSDEGIPPGLLAVAAGARRCSASSRSHFHCWRSRLDKRPAPPDRRPQGTGRHRDQGVVPIPLRALARGSCSSTPAIATDRPGRRSPPMPRAAGSTCSPSISVDTARAAARAPTIRCSSSGSPTANGRSTSTRRSRG